MSLRYSLLFCGLLVGGAVFSGCTPGSSQSSTMPDTTAVHQSNAVRDTAHTEAQRSPPPSSDSERSPAERLQDATVETRIKRALVADRRLRAFDFAPQAVRGRVTLRGDVETRAQYRRAERIARDVQGVRTLTNRVTVEGQPVLEDESTSPASDNHERAYYTVRQGDTLWDIAQEHGISVAQIRALNSNSGTSLQPGERIRVR